MKNYKYKILKMGFFLRELTLGIYHMEYVKRNVFHTKPIIKKTILNITKKNYFVKTLNIKNKIV